MCFSATASFTAAGVTGAIGLVCLTRVNRPRESLLAATPLLFALQQAIEGALWLVLPDAPHGPAAQGLTVLYLILAQVFWPLYAPVAVILTEVDRSRRRAMLAALAIGAAVSAYLLWRLIAGPHGAVLMDDHIVYVTRRRHTRLVALAYLTATCAPLLLSSLKSVVALGAVVMVGSVVAYVAYWHAFQSVWCFFAAAGSLLLLAHFQFVRAPRRRPAVA